jgi:hypothetical protein
MRVSLRCMAFPLVSAQRRSNGAALAIQAGTTHTRANRAVKEEE